MSLIPPDVTTFDLELYNPKKNRFFIEIMTHACLFGLPGSRHLVDAFPSNYSSSLSSFVILYLPLVAVGSY